METKAYKKSIIREISSSKARFFSILVIILLGVSFFSGIKSSGPDMDKAINEFYRSQNLMDSKIVSGVGLTDKDLEILKSDDNILDFYGTRSIDVNLTNINNLVKFMEYDGTSKINDYVVLEGRLPENSGEIALDERAFTLNKDLKIGDEYIINSDEDTLKNFSQTKFTIVGSVRSPMYIEKEARGITNVGKGTIDYFAVLNTKDISMDVYTEIYLRFKNVQGLDAYSDEYIDLMEENNKYLETLYSERSVERIEEVKADIQIELDKGYKDIEDGEKQLQDAEKQIEDGRKQLEEGKSQYNKAVTEFEKQMKDGETNLVAGRKGIEEGQKELDKQKDNINQGQKQLDQAKAELDKAREVLLSQGVDPDKSTSELESNISNLKTLVNGETSLSNDIKNTISNINGEAIPADKIQSWKGTIDGLGLNDLSNAVSELEKDPNNISIAQDIANSLDEVVKSNNENIAKLEVLLGGITTYQKGKGQYDEQLAIFNIGKGKLDEAQKKIDSGKVELTKGEKALEQGKVKGKNELEKVKTQLSDAEKELIDGEKEIEENRPKLLEGKAEIAEQEKSAFENLEKSKYFYFDRTDNQGYSGYKDSIKSLDNIASVLPVFFFLVAVMICLTTMTRMVEENRIEIGTLKALGYGDLEISWKYIIYASLASISGSVLGIIIGSTILPSIISGAYGSLYSIPDLKLYFYPSFIIQSLAISILCTVGAALFVIRVELKDKPSNLMKAKAPKLGKKILIERITPVWSRLSFNHKVTLRNIFRYKQRMIMTVLGIAGCMALLVTGFGLKDSNEGVVVKQFDELWKYDAMVILDESSSEENYKIYNDTLSNIAGYENKLNIYQESVTFSKEDMNKQTATIYVPEDTTKLDNFMVLRDRVSGEEYEITDNGVIINEKLAKLLGVKANDTVTFNDDNNNSYTVNVDRVVENYAMHYIYMSPVYYEEVFGEKPVYNTEFLTFSDDKESDEKISSTLLECENVLNVTLKSQMEKTTADLNESMNLVMLVIIVAAGCLAFVVLYNLNNINVSERIRELSTIKVLGFFNNEVTMYILRENIILTLMGVVAGGFLGKLLHAFIIHTAETDTMMMYPNVDITSYILSGLITIFFSLVVMVLMHIKLKKVNMIDALKSNE